MVLDNLREGVLDHMTFQKMCQFCIVCIVLACFTLVVAGVLSSQTQFSATIPANTINVPVTLANPVYYNETITAVGVSTPPAP